MTADALTKQLWILQVLLVIKLNLRRKKPSARAAWVQASHDLLVTGLVALFTVLSRGVAWIFAARL